MSFIFDISFCIQSVLIFSFIIYLLDIYILPVSQILNFAWSQAKSRAQISTSAQGGQTSRQKRGARSLAPLQHGAQRDRGYFTDIDACAGESGDCNQNGGCNSTAGSFTCAGTTRCSRNGVTCTGIDKCARKLDDWDCCTFGVLPGQSVEVLRLLLQTPGWHVRLSVDTALPYVWRAAGTICRGAPAPASDSGLACQATRLALLSQHITLFSRHCIAVRLACCRYILSRCR